jgi:hypothetical protein
MVVGARPCVLVDVGHARSMPARWPDALRGATVLLTAGAGGRTKESRQLGIPGDPPDAWDGSSRWSLPAVPVGHANRTVKKGGDVGGPVRCDGPAVR